MGHCLADEELEALAQRVLEDGGDGAAPQREERPTHRSYVEWRGKDAILQARSRKVTPGTGNTVPNNPWDESVPVPVGAPAWKRPSKELAQQSFQLRVVAASTWAEGVRLWVDILLEEEQFSFEDADAVTARDSGGRSVPLELDALLSEDAVAELVFPVTLTVVQKAAHRREATAAPAAIPPTTRIRQIAVPWLAQDERQLSVMDGEFVIAWTSHRTESGWIYAQKDNRDGWLPESALKPEQNESKQWMRVANDWVPQDASQVGAKEGDHVRVWMQTRVEEGWVYVEVPESPCDDDTVEPDSASGRQRSEGRSLSPGGPEMSEGWFPVFGLEWRSQLGTIEAIPIRGPDAQQDSAEAQPVPQEADSEPEEGAAPGARAHWRKSRQKDIRRRGQASRTSSRM